MGNVNWSELFPNRGSVIIFALYVLLFVNQGILVTASQKSDNQYEYNIVTVVLLTEFFKLITSATLYCQNHSIQSLVRDSIKHKNVLALYLVPALLYCFYNNLSFINLSTFDPTTYYLLLQFRVVITAVLFQIIFKKKLTRKQWISLLILTIGCMLKQVSFTKLFNLEQDKSSPQLTKNTGFTLDVTAVMILIQTTCSCLAGVYNEYLLKETGANVNIFVQNVFMYLDSILCNFLVLCMQGNVYEAFTVDSLSKVLHYKVLVIMINNAAVGIITSFFLKNMNSILKTFASALELVFTAILSYLLFSIQIHFNTVLSICTVLLAIYLYSQSPVVNRPGATDERRNEREDEQRLMVEEV